MLRRQHELLDSERFYVCKHFPVNAPNVLNSVQHSDRHFSQIFRHFSVNTIQVRSATPTSTVYSTRAFRKPTTHNCSEKIKFPMSLTFHLNLRKIGAPRFTSPICFKWKKKIKKYVLVQRHTDPYANDEPRRRMKRRFTFFPGRTYFHGIPYARDEHNLYTRISYRVVSHTIL